jgi:ribosomal protein S18 acetylase RimI-like enzyme
MKPVTKQSEWNFITNYTYRNIRFWSEHVAKLDVEAFDRNANMLHQFWKDKCECRVLVAKEDPNIFLGFIIWQELSEKEANLWFVGIKEMYRSIGLATTLVEACCADYEKLKYYFHTHSVDKIQNKLNKKRKKPIRPETQAFFDKLYLCDIYNGFVDLTK